MEMAHMTSLLIVVTRLGLDPLGLIRSASFSNAVTLIRLTLPTPTQSWHHRAFFYATPPGLSSVNGVKRPFGC